MVAHFGDMKLGRKDEKAVKAFYRAVPLGGREDRIQFMPLKDKLKLRYRPEDFDPYKNILQRHKLIDTVQGGAVYRKPRGDPQETFYYEPIRRELELYWAEQPKLKYHLRQHFLRVLDTHSGPEDGRWARPDLTLLGGKVLPYLPGKFLDVVTFEVKVRMTVDGLYEALAHRRRANYSYLVCVCPLHLGTPDPSEEAIIVAEAARQGLGVILVQQEDDFDLWRELVEPVRHEPYPQLLHDFLETQCNKEGCLEDLRKWIDRDAFDLPPVTDDDLCRLDLTTKELTVAKKLVERIASSDESCGPTSLRNITHDDTMMARVKDVLKSVEFIQTVQGGGVKRAKAIY